MSAPEPMPSARRHPIPGMTKHTTTSPDPPPEPEPLATGKGVTDQDADERPSASAADGSRSDLGLPRSRHPTETSDSRRRWPGTDTAGSDPGVPRSRHPAETTDSRRRWPATDYAATRLANFRIPVTLLDRYRQLVRETEDRDPRLRRLSVTEVVIGLLQEGPTTPDEIAELIRRKRAAEHGLEG